jgi:glycerol-3-phosphate acyltransferase PlsY
MPLASPVSLILALLVGYLLGSIPFGLLLTRLAGLGDIRSIGSGNIGATNVLRTGRRSLAAATLILDALKGTAAVLIAGIWFGPTGAIVAGLGAFLGHVFPIWLRFAGGKGVATLLGVVMALDWRAALAFAAVWLITAAVTRYSSLSALAGSVAVPIAFYVLGEPLAAAVTALLAVVLWYRHKANIGRLVAGTESRIGSKEPGQPASGTR